MTTRATQETEAEKAEREHVESTIATGVYRGLRKLFDMLAMYAAAIIAITFAVDFFDLRARDSTDPVTGDRSGMTVLTDAMTGCQYLTTANGGLTPRNGENGFQVCEKVTAR